MTRIDRYLIRVFVRTLLITYLSLTGIFIVIHAFTNLGELAVLADQQGWLLGLLGYYGPYSLIIFDWTCPILILLALLFSLGWLRRNGELTPLLASGIGYGRLLRPLVGASLVVVTVAAANRETLLPAYRDRLGARPQELTSDVERPLQPCFDRKTGILINGRYVILKNEEILEPNFLSRAALGTLGTTLAAPRAEYYRAAPGRPAGYLLLDVTIPNDIDRHADVSNRGKKIVFTNRENDWVPAGSCFVRSDVAFELLRAGSTARKLATTPELVRRIRNSSVHVDADTRVHTHSRFVRPFLDVTLLLLGVPLAVGRDDRNLFVVAGYGLMVVLGFYAVRTAFMTLGSFGYLENTALAAWMPFVVLGPVAYARFCGAAEK